MTITIGSLHEGEMYMLTSLECVLGGSVTVPKGSIEIGQGFFMKVRGLQVHFFKFIFYDWTVPVIQGGIEKGAGTLHEGERTPGSLL